MGPSAEPAGLGWVSRTPSAWPTWSAWYRVYRGARVLEACSRSARLWGPHTRDLVTVARIVRTDYFGLASSHRLPAPLAALLELASALELIPSSPSDSATPFVLASGSALTRIVNLLVDSRPRIGLGSGTSAGTDTPINVEPPAGHDRDGRKFRTWPGSDSDGGTSVAAVASQLGLPWSLVSLRHRVTHADLPPAELLLTACATALAFLVTRYFDPQQALVHAGVAAAQARWQGVLRAQKTDPTQDALGPWLEHTDHGPTHALGLASQLVSAELVAVAPAAGWVARAAVRMFRPSPDPSQRPRPDELARRATVLQQLCEQLCADLTRLVCPMAAITLGSSTNTTCWERYYPVPSLQDILRPPGSTAAPSLATRFQQAQQLVGLLVALASGLHYASLPEPIPHPSSSPSSARILRRASGRPDTSINVPNTLLTGIAARLALRQVELLAAIDPELLGGWLRQNVLDTLPQTGESRPTCLDDAGLADYIRAAVLYVVFPVTLHVVATYARESGSRFPEPWVSAVQTGGSPHQVRHRAQVALAALNLTWIGRYVGVYNTPSPTASLLIQPLYKTSLYRAGTLIQALQLLALQAGPTPIPWTSTLSAALLQNATVLPRSSIPPQAPTLESPTHDNNSLAPDVAPQRIQKPSFGRSYSTPVNVWIEYFGAQAVGVSCCIVRG